MNAEQGLSVVGPPDEADTRPLLTAESVVKRYRKAALDGQWLTALQDVSIEVRAGRSIGVVGESGSGKTTLLRLLLHLERPTSGEIRFRGEPTSHFGTQKMRRLRREIQAVFQDPRSSLDPRDRVWRLVTEPAEVSLEISRSEQLRLAEEMLDLVDLPSSYLHRRPAELSGGECQRLAIARALSSGPSVVMLDEPVTSLDASLRGLVLNLLRRLSRERGCTYVVVSHDVTAIYYLTNHLYVIYRGMVVEEGPTVEVVSRPLHPYTRLLVGSVNAPLSFAGDEALRPDLPGRCPFLSRCSEAMPQCSGEMPPVTKPRAEEHHVRCYLWPEPEEAGR